MTSTYNMVGWIDLIIGIFGIFLSLSLFWVNWVVAAFYFAIAVLCLVSAREAFLSSKKLN